MSIDAALPFGNGITYTGLCRVREDKYGKEGPRLLRDVLALIEELRHAVDPVALADLNDASLTLGALAPVWFDFSVACLHAVFQASFCGSTTVYVGVKEAFDRCMAKAAQGLSAA